MALKCSNILFCLQVTTVCWLISLIPNCSSAYELQDTIHALKEENLHLQHRLENLTRAFRDLKHLLMDQPRVPGGEHDREFVHAWHEWGQHGISSEIHHLLEQVFCSPDLHGAAEPVSTSAPVLPLLLLLLLSPLIWLSPIHL